MRKQARSYYLMEHENQMPNLQVKSPATSSSTGKSSKSESKATK